MKKEQITIANIVDKINLYKKTGKIITTHFLDPVELIEIENIISKIPNCCFGGFEEAERKIILLGSESIEDAKEKVQIITIESKQKLSHRDVLGSILGLGIKREVLGDIIVNDNRADVFVINEISNYILQNLERIGKEKVQSYLNEYENLLKKEEKVKEIKTTVPSLRLDAIISAGIGVSREVSSKLIQSQKIKLNYKLIENTSKKITIGDKISIRGYGRIEVQEILGETRKERIRIVLKKY